MNTMIFIVILLIQLIGKKLVSDLNNAISNEYLIDRIIFSSKNNNKLIKL